MEKLSESAALVATIDPQLADDTTVVSDWVEMGNGRCVTFYLSVGATDTTVDAKLRQATDGSGTGAADITGKAITQMSATDDNKQKVLEIVWGELTDGYTHVALSVTAGNGTTGAQISAVGLQSALRYEPATHSDLASVAEIVS